MSRYKTTPLKRLENGRRILSTTAYVDVPRTEDDWYIFPTVGDRYDLLALSYYQNSGLWWVISLANPNKEFDSLIPPIGEQIRIPSISTANELESQYS